MTILRRSLTFATVCSLLIGSALLTARSTSTAAVGANEVPAGVRQALARAHSASSGEEDAPMGTRQAAASSPNRACAGHCDAKEDL
jgi:hypothetical protein